MITGYLIDGEWSRRGVAQFAPGCLGMGTCFLCATMQRFCRCHDCRVDCGMICESCCADKRPQFSCSSCVRPFKHHGSDALCGYDDCGGAWDGTYRYDMCEHCAGERWCTTCYETMRAMRWFGAAYGICLEAELRPNQLDRFRHDGSLEWVYFLKSDCGRVKIGKAGVVENRIRGILSMNPDPSKLTLLGACLGGRPLELDLHRELDDYRLHGEWFTWCAEVERVINSALAVPAPSNLDVVHEWLAFRRSSPAPSGRYHKILRWLEAA